MFLDCDPEQCKTVTAGRADLNETIRCRTVFLSDVHLGTRACQALQLLAFLESVRADRIYLVGDIFDGWRLKRSWHWPQAHNDVVQKLLRQARKGVEMIYVPGNHDEILRDYCGFSFGGIEVVREAVHPKADGRRLLVTHGDATDAVMKHMPWLSNLGDGSYRLARTLGGAFNWCRRKLGFRSWSLAEYFKKRVNDAVKFTDRFEHAVVAEARHRGVDGVVCGHIHYANLRQVDGLLYCNTGDWVGSATALVEDFDGRLEIVRWAESEPRVAASLATAA